MSMRETFFNKTLKIVAFFTVAVLWAGAAAASIEVKDAWIKAHGDEGALYMMISNSGSAPDHLYAAKSTVSKRAKLHKEAAGGHGAKKAHGHDGMKSITMIKIEPGHPVQLKADGSHILLQKLTGQLKPGDKVAVKLFFKKAGTVNFEATVK